MNDHDATCKHIIQKVKNIWKSKTLATLPREDASAKIAAEMVCIARHILLDGALLSDPDTKEMADSVASHLRKSVSKIDRYSADVKHNRHIHRIKER